MTPADDAAGVDRYDARLVTGAAVPDLLRTFNRAGLLAPADVHAAVRLARLAGEADPRVLLAVALAVRGPRFGHVAVDLTEVHRSAVAAEEDVDISALPWPDPDSWLPAVQASSLVGMVGSGDRPGAVAPHPLRLDGPSLYLDRYWSDEVELALDLLARAARTAPPAPPAPSPPTVPPVSPVGPGAERARVADPGGADDETLERYFPGPSSADQRAAAASAALHRFSVIAGGPGTGKTTTVARLLAFLCEGAVAAGRRPPLMALAAPTGKAAARMEEAVRAESERLDIDGAVRRAVSEVRGTTVHRLLGVRADRSGRFRHHRGHRLPHQIVVLDEASMVSLPLMARLVEAVRDDARLILVGDPEQLVSVEAGAVLADIANPFGALTPPTAPDQPAGDPARRSARHPTRQPAPPPGPLAGCVSVLRTNHRFGGLLAGLAEAVRSGDADGAMAVLSRDDAEVGWIDADPAAVLEGWDPALPSSAPPGAFPLALGPALDWARSVRDAGRAGHPEAALAALRRHRILCAHRQGPSGAGDWNRAVEAAVAAGEPAAGTWYPGRPVLVTVNDYALRIFNGDTGVVAAVPGADGAAGAAWRVFFEQGPGAPLRELSPSRLASVETVFAMTVHKSQGSEFDEITLLLPPASSRLLTRELLYTAVTRARRRVVIVGTEEAVRAGVGRPAARASGLAARLGA
ncbi:MAG TPA: exodeoxyribonuclease V subunit alpha [Acidimicrobiales bacterium]|nr:exodeoxyribonuclease V subunit alpha [Acidimicrobiales bacterium]